MLVKENVRLQRIINGTWKSALTILIVCLSSCIFNELFLKKFIDFPGIFPSLLGTTLAFFIGFNNNQAYARWWEGRIIIGGISGLSRLFARQCVSNIHDRTEVEKMINRQIGFIYALKDHLRNTSEKSYEKYFKTDMPEMLKNANNKYNAILLLQHEHLDRLYSLGNIDGFKFKLLNETLAAVSNEMGKADRIKNTVFPTTYTFYTKIFIWIFIVSVTIVLNDAIGMAAFLLGFVIGYVYYVSHLIGRTLLNPFDATPTGIPLDHIIRGTERDLRETFGEKNLPEPISLSQDEYIL